MNASASPGDVTVTAPRSPVSSDVTTLHRLMHDRHILVCCGSGGVGKTTVSAALALRAADERMHSIVCTIDPAKRLAQALGLESLSNEPLTVPDRSFQGRKPRGHLDAMMLDTKRTFDEMVLSMTSRERAERIFSNPFYRHVSSTLSGTQEYMAMEKLWELHEEGRWELIVIDTPPTRSALDFLDAPRRMTDFFDSRFLRVMLWPYVQAGRSTFRVMNVGARLVLRAATRITGSELLEDVAGFFAAFEGMYGDFKARAQRVRELLAARRTAFLVITTPQEQPLKEARFFVERLAKERMPLGGVIVNRAHSAHVVPGLEHPGEVGDLARKAGEDSLLGATLRTYAAWLEEADREDRMIAAALGDLGVPIWRIPDFAEEVHSLPALRRVSDELLGPVGRHG